ncbi:MarR family transcriptional regulator [Rhodococcoides fascians]|uniref:MarR family winged helix-turn-helix transcriptional regulator n=1 Tax=Rhodococcoides fascians TaxID=1828 RepID=UPI002ACDCED8|nr:MarR family transcriptional regulator [Rhodococcus fascians]WQH28819.1 MarR family transcriptional regulator [Rhodococcus fascians]
MATEHEPHSVPGPDVTSCVLAVAAVLRAQKALSSHLDSTLRPLGLSFARYEVLTLIVAANGPLPIMRIVRALDRHPTTVGTFIDGLESAGWIEREANRSDRRSTLVVVTDSGREVAFAASRALAAIELLDPQLMLRLHKDLQDLLTAARLPKQAGPNGIRVAAVERPGGTS